MLKFAAENLGYRAVTNRLEGRIINDYPKYQLEDHTSRGLLGTKVPF
jgi:hypothetical protein